MTSARIAPLSTHPPLVRALLAQLLGLIAAVGMALLLAGLSILPLLLLQGVVAAAAARWLQLPIWWQVIELLFLPSSLLLLQLSIDPLWFLAAFLGLASLSWGAVSGRVPLYLTNHAAEEALLQLLPHRSPLRFLDVGCGFGGVMQRVAMARPDAEVDGIENAPLSYLISRIRLLGRRSVTLYWGNLWHHSFSRYDVVYLYLSPAPMAAIGRKAHQEMRPGSLLISHAFTIPDLPPDLTLPYGQSDRAQLYLWRL